MKINKAYLDKFIKAKNYYMFPLAKGIYLCFNNITLEYEGLEMYYLPSYQVDYYASKKLEELYSRSILI